jgi:hypothetical protein
MDKPGEFRQAEPQAYYYNSKNQKMPFFVPEYAKQADGQGIPGHGDEDNLQYDKRDRIYAFTHRAKTVQQSQHNGRC